MKYYNYNSPIKYLIAGIIELGCAAFFGRFLFLIIRDHSFFDSWFTLLIVVLTLAPLLFGVFLLKYYLSNGKKGVIEIDETSISIPGMEMPQPIPLDLLKHLEDLTRDDEMILIYIEEDLEGFLIEKEWMKKEDFKDLLNRLMTFTQAKSAPL